MRPLDVERSLLALLAVPLATLTVAGGAVTVSALDAGAQPRRVQHLTEALPALLRLEQMLVAERADVLVADAASRRRLAADRGATDGALTASLGVLGPLRGDPTPAGSAAGALARLPDLVARARRAADAGGAAPGAAEDAYAVASDLVIALPRTVAATLPDRVLAASVRRIAAGMDAAEAAARTRLAGDVLLARGPAATRADADRLVARRAVLDVALAGLVEAGVPARTGADVVRLRTGNVTGATRAPGPPASRGGWDAAADRVTSGLRALVVASSGDAALAASGASRRYTLEALAGALVALGVVGGSVAHATATGRAFRRALTVVTVRGAGARVPVPRSPDDLTPPVPPSTPPAGFTEAPSRIPAQRARLGSGWTRRPLDGEPQAPSLP